MPTYDYRCEACRHTFEKTHSIKAPPIRKCPKCGKLKVKIVIGRGSGVLFKGTGFYQTDYRSKSYTDAASKDKPATPTADKSASTPPPPAKNDKSPSK